MGNVANPSRSRSAERFLILRDWSRAGHHLTPIMAELSAHKVKIFDYFLPHEGSYETFHAKLLLADDTRAYVGSANFLRTGKIAWNWASWSRDMQHARSGLLAKR